MTAESPSHLARPATRTGLEHTPGGSSSGSAAAVAAHMTPFALGTQTAGSVIRPAAFQESSVSCRHVERLYAGVKQVSDIARRRGLLCELGRRCSVVGIDNGAASRMARVESRRRCAGQWLTSYALDHSSPAMADASRHRRAGVKGSRCRRSRNRR